MDENGNALKAIKATDDTLVVGNYMVLWGSPDQRDLEGIASPRRNPDGTLGEYFTPDTDFKSAYTDAGLFYVDWEHGQDPAPGAPGKNDVLGVVNWATAEADMRGLWVERALNRRSQYVKFLEPLIEAGIVGSSSEPTQDGVQKAQDGQIVRWPLRRDTLTVTPMEPRMLLENPVLRKSVQGLAALGVSCCKSILPNDPEPEEPDAGEGDARAFRQRAILVRARAARAQIGMSI